MLFKHQTNILWKRPLMNPAFDAFNAGTSSLSTAELESKGTKQCFEASPVITEWANSQEYGRQQISVEEAFVKKQKTLLSSNSNYIIIQRMSRVILSKLQKMELRIDLHLHPIAKICVALASLPTKVKQKAIFMLESWGVPLYHFKTAQKVRSCNQLWWLCTF